MGNFFKGWGMLEYSLLGVIMLLICVVAALFLGVGGLFLEEELAQQQTSTPTPSRTFVTVTPTSSPGEAVGPPGGGDVPADTQNITLSPTTGAPGSTITVSGEGWPAGGLVVISLAPSEPPAYSVNSAVVESNGIFSVDIIVPSDPRWLNESSVPIIASLDGRVSAQALLTIVNPGDGPAITPVPPSDNVQPTPTIPLQRPMQPN